MTSTSPPHCFSAVAPEPGAAIIVSGSNPAIVRATSAWAASAAGISSPYSSCRAGQHISVRSCARGLRRHAEGHDGRVTPSSVSSGTVEVGTPVAEETPRVAVAPTGVEVERRHQHRLVVAARLGHLGAGGVGDERRPVERDLGRLAGLVPDPVGRHQGREVGPGVSLHHPLPVAAGVPVGIRGLAADGGRVEQHVGAEQGHAAGGLREPLVPADADADGAVPRLPHPEPGVARVEVVLLGVARAVGDVALAVRAERRAVGVDDHDRVVGGPVGPLVHAERQDHFQLGGQLAEVVDGRVAVERAGPVEVLGEHVLAEVRPFEQLRKEHDLGALRGRVADEPFGGLDVGVDLLGHRHLHRGHGELHEVMLRLAAQASRSSCSGRAEDLAVGVADLVQADPLPPGR